MSEQRLKHTARYFYPGSFLPEDTTRELPAPTLEVALRYAPDDQEGYFRKDGWYAVEITTTTQKRFVAADGEETWGRVTVGWVGGWVIGERIHADDIEANDRNRILISDIRCNSKDGFGVLTRCGNWQIAGDYDHVLTPAEVSA